MIEEFKHKFLGFGRVPSECRIKMITDNGKTIFCFINIDIGTSVTNASEQLASDMVNKYNLLPNDCLFFETYNEYNYDSFDEITYSWYMKGNKWEAVSPAWSFNSSNDKYKDMFLK